jgi:DNA-binding transcriptional ArsR family regulator
MSAPTETAAPPDEPLDAIFAALASPVRRRLLSRLAEGDQPVNTLAAPFAMSRPAVSQHLHVLLEAGLVSEQRAGRERLYRLEAERLRAVREWLRIYERFWREHLNSLGDYLDEEQKP